LHNNPKESLDDFFVVQGVLFLLKKFITSGVFLINRLLLVLDGNDNNVTLKEIEYTQEFRLNMIILSSHTSHVLQPLDVSSFKSFKTIF
jgi:hypothetical protein